jgi:hypothetical protein
MRVRKSISSLWLAILFAGFAALSGCNNSTAVAESKWLFLPAFFGKSTSLEQSQAPWRLTLQSLSEAQLLDADGIGESKSPASSASSPTTTVTLKLRLQSQDPTLRIADLLQTQAPSYSSEQAQNALFYHMTEAGYLQLADKDVRPVTAYVEMTTQREQYLDIVFVFSLARPALEQASAVRFVLDKAFFLSQPVEFTLPAAQLLPAS